MTGAGGSVSSLARRFAAGVGRNAWMLAASLLVVFAVYEWGDQAATAWAAVLSLIALAGVVPWTSDRKPSTLIELVEGSGVERLSSRDLAAAISDPIVVFDGSGAIVHANAAALAAFGALNVGMPVQMKFRAPEMQALIEGALRSRVGSSVIDYVERVPVERLFRVTVSVVGVGEGLRVLTFKDQSEVRRIDRMRADFIANASHELRTPLASISGFVETLRGPARNDVAARDRFLEIMQGQTARMARLIDDLLSLSRLEMKAYAKAATEVDLRGIVDSVIDSLHPMAQELEVAIERDFEDASFGMMGDRDELFQVFENLLENACKYGQSGGRVVLAMRRNDAGPRPEIDVTVRDFGPGIAEQHIPRITERFYRVDVATSRAQKGTGLGLSIVKHILTRHNARLSIVSELGEGASFTVHLPAA